MIRTLAARWAGWAIAACVLAATILNLVLITHPLWMNIAGAIAPLAGGWLAQRLPTGMTSAAA